MNIAKLRSMSIKALLVSVLMVLSNSQAMAVDPTFTAVFSDKAIRGYDTVAYFTQGKAVEGESQFSFEYQQATWLFSSADNLQAFKLNPEKYAPQYGGYCAYAVSQNSTASIQPELFTIVEGKLYLNYSESINTKWRMNMKDFIEKADSNWPKLLND